MLRSAMHGGLAHRTVTIAVLAVMVIAAAVGCSGGTNQDSGPTNSRSDTDATSASLPTRTPDRPSSISPSKGSASSTTAVSAAPADKQQASGKTAVAVLTTLAVKGRGSKAGYTRDQFGSAWTDDNASPSGHNNCNTRGDILRRDVTKPVGSGCDVRGGTIVSPYTAAAVPFGDIQIDHVVALGDAWQTGAAQWSEARRIELANDPLNLLAVDAFSNEQKKDADAASWLPRNKSYRCAYVARQVGVKARYGLWVKPAERDAISTILKTCPGQTVPVEAQPVESPGKASLKTGVAVPHATPVPTQLAPTPPADAYYADCAAVRDAGKSPIRRGEPGYRSRLDRDGDGVGCE